MRVDIIERNSYYELEQAINDFLKRIDCSRVVDIKYSGMSNRTVHGNDYYSAMIILKN